jgi:hypothetical protein
LINNNKENREKKKKKKEEEEPGKEKGEWCGNTPLALGLQRP